MYSILNLTVINYWSRFCNSYIKDLVVLLIIINSYYYLLFQDMKKGKIDEGKVEREATLSDSFGHKLTPLIGWEFGQCVSQQGMRGMTVSHASQDGKLTCKSHSY